MHILQQYKQWQKNLPLCLLPVISPIASASFILPIGTFGFGFAATAVTLYRRCKEGEEDSAARTS